MTRRSLYITGLVVVWASAIVAGHSRLLHYQSEPGRPALAADWPSGSAIQAVAGRSTLLLFAHPCCPCTRASLEELSQALARSAGRVDAHVVFVLPEGAPADWGRTPLWGVASSIPGVRSFSDAGGRESSLFGVATSGQVLLFDPRGTLVFSGGLTAGRGHAGDNPARRALVECFAGRAAGRRDFPVYGCPLFGGDPTGREESEECTP